VTVTNQNLIQEELKKRLNSGNACYHSFKNLLLSHLLLKNIKNRILSYNCYNTKIYLITNFLESQMLCFHYGGTAFSFLR
jgi:hypothetical protein